ncbi:hypothetical protein HU200_005878 [Digitaria exilis]|uniref:Uncharacterized protein n=1 Tax=Digitaria exilis TaxID=1010633 RepID=A0A835KSB3_9POAL|nr:hypothetical protein HU200_005878 [Digitaria exilis]
MILTVGRDGDARIVVEGRGNILKIFARSKGGAGSEEWALEKTIHVTAVMLGLPQLRFFHLTSDQPHYDEGIVRVLGYDGGRAPGGTSMRFHLDMDTMEAERLPGCDLGFMRKEFPSEFPWPPTLRACTNDNA